MVKRLGTGCLGVVGALLLAILLIPWPEVPPVDQPQTPRSAAPREAGDGQPPQMWRPSFAVLPQGRWKSGTRTSLLDYHGVDTVSLRLANQVNRMPFPTHHCRLQLGRDADLATTEAETERYAACLMAAWQPWLAQHGAASLTLVRLKHCGRPGATKLRACRDADSFLGRADRDTIYLSPRAVPQRRDLVDLELVVAHEVGHLLQHQVRPREGGEQALVLAVADRDDKRLSRRFELQVECMSVAMVAADGRHPGLAERNAALAFTSDDEHWDAARHREWSRRATRGIVGECNATLAQDALVAHSGARR